MYVCIYFQDHMIYPMITKHVRRFGTQCVVQTLIIVVLLRSLQNKSHRGQPGGFEEEVGGRRKKGWPFFRRAAFRRSLCFYGALRVFDCAPCSPKYFEA